MTVLAFALVIGGGMYFADHLTGEDAEYTRLVEDYALVAGRTEAIRHECSRLEAEQKALVSRDTTYLEKVIRQEMDYVRPNDVVVYFRD